MATHNININIVMTKSPIPKQSQSKNKHVSFFSHPTSPPHPTLHCWCSGASPPGVPGVPGAACPPPHPPYHPPQARQIPSLAPPGFAGFNISPMVPAFPDFALPSSYASFPVAGPRAQISVATNFRIYRIYISLFPFKHISYF